MHGVIGAMDDTDGIVSRALRALQARVGGRIIRDKLYPIVPSLTALRPLEPACELQRKWHVVHTEPQQEGRVEEQLRAAKYDAFCPRQPLKIRVNAVKHRTVFRPLVVGYVFAGFDPAIEPWQAISSMRGVVRVLMLDTRPIPVIDAVIVRLRQEEERCRGRATRNLIPPELQVGKLVRVLEPLSFAGLFGFIVGLDSGKCEVRVEIDILGRLVPLNLRPDQVEVVG